MITKTKTIEPASSLEIDTLHFAIRRSQRRKTLELSVGRNGELTVRAPSTSKDGEIRAWVQSKLLWVHQKLARKAEGLLKPVSPQYTSGESFHYLGRAYRLQIVKEQKEKLRFDGYQFCLRADARSIAPRLFRNWYREQGHPWLNERIQLLARRVGVLPTQIEIRELAYRWGSCGKNRQIYFHWKLLRLPVHLIDYVVVHELAHLIEPNHGANFWACLDRALPDWQERRAELERPAVLFLR